jgi:hypothetical protein
VLLDKNLSVFLWLHPFSARAFGSPMPRGLQE